MANLDVGAAVTVTVTGVWLGPSVAVNVAEPIFLAVTMPLNGPPDTTVNVVGSELVHVTWLVMFPALLLAENCNVDPSNICGCVGVTLIPPAAITL